MTPLVDTAGEVWLEGCLLAWHPGRDELLIAFSDMALNEPCWLPRGEIRIELYTPGRFGWGCFRLPRWRVKARTSAAQERQAARQQREDRRTPRMPPRSKMLTPKQATARRAQMALFP